MKKILLILALIFLCFGLPTILSLDANSLAVRGCCMQRDNLNSPHWYNNGLDFKSCRDLNSRTDGDDLFQQGVGLIYWKENC
jgi:hypothetical protein